MKNLVFGLFILFPILSTAADSKTPPATSNTENPLRCEKFSDGGLAELKEKLWTHCNLDKPYTSSVARDPLSSNEVYYYCCHKKSL